MRVRARSSTPPSWCRLAAGVAAAALAAVILAAPAAVAGGPIGYETFGMSPLSPGSGGAGYFIMTAAAGDTVEGTVEVVDRGPSTETVKLSRSAGTTAGNGGSAFSGAFQRCSGAGCWLTGLPATVTLAPGTARALQFWVRVPAGTRPGQYLAGITAQLAGAPTSVNLGSHHHAGMRAIVIQQVTVAVAVTVGRLSELRTQLRIPNVFGSAIQQLPRLNVVLDNTGQTFTRAVGQASCAVGGRQLTFRVLAATVLPGDEATIPANAIGLPAGPAIPCTVRLRYGRGQVVTWTGQITIPGAPHVRLIHTGPGVYTAIPVGGIPSWAMALIVIGGLLLAGVAALIALRMRAIRRTA